eukprot:6406903-Prymnesium_polylepis.2
MVVVLQWCFPSLGTAGGSAARLSSGCGKSVCEHHLALPGSVMEYGSGSCQESGCAGPVVGASEAFRFALVVACIAVMSTATWTERASRWTGRRAFSDFEAPRKKGNRSRRVGPKTTQRANVASLRLRRFRRTVF